jgi:hypothetical protein
MSLSVLLLLGSALVVAVSVGSGRMLGPAAVIALLAGTTATRMVAIELAEARRDAARERTQVALSFHRLAARTAYEQARFSLAMNARLAAGEQRTARVRRALRVAMRRADAADKQATAGAVRIAALEHELAQLQQALDAQVPAEHELTGWDGAVVGVPQVPTVVDLVAVDKRSAAASARVDWRRHA